MRAKVVAGLGLGVRPIPFGPRRADLGPRRAGEAGVPGEHGRPGRRGPDGLLSSHQIGEVERVASHVALMHQGRLIRVEPLDELKSRTFLLSVMFTSRDHPAVPPEGRMIELIDASDAPRQARWLVRAYDRAACESIRALPGVEGLEIETPSLEEIYIGTMRGRRPAPSPMLAVHVA